VIARLGKASLSVFMCGCSLQFGLGNGRAAFQKRVNVFAVYPHEFTGRLACSQATIANLPLDVPDSAAEKFSRLLLA
jgi:hypothetical protein